MAELLTKDQAKALRDKGLISEDQYATFAPEQSPPPMSVEERFDPSLAPLPEPAPMPATPAIDPNDPLGRQRAFWADKKARDDAAVAQAEQAAAQRQFDEETADITRRREIATKMGVPQAEIDANLPLPVMQQPSTAIQPPSGVIQASNMVDGVGPLEPAVPEGMNPEDDPTLGLMLQQQAMYDQAVDPLIEQQELLAEASRRGQSLANEESAYHERMQANMERQMRENQIWEESQRTILEEKRAKLDEYGEKVLSKTIDPNRYWANKPTWTKIAAVFGMALGGGVAARGGQNTAMEMINAAINRDIEAQRSEINSGRELYNAKAGVYRDMLDMFKDKRVAKAAAMAQSYQIAQMGLNSIAARYKGVDAKLKFGQLNAQLEQTKQQYRMQFAQSLRDTMYQRALYSGRPIPEFMLKPEDRKLAVGSGNRWYGIGRSTEGVNRIKGKIGDVESGMDALRELIRIAEKSRAQKLSPQLQSDARTLLNTVKGKLRTSITGPGAASDAEWKILDDTIPDPSKILSLGTAKGQLEIILRMSENAWRRELQGEGLTLPEDRRRVMYDEQAVQK